MTERDFVIWGEEENENKPPRAWCCSVGATQKLLKEELRRHSRLSRDLLLACACSCVQWLWQQRTQRDRVMLKGLWDTTSAAGVQGSVHGGVQAQEPCERATGWGLDSQELSAGDLLQPRRSPHRQASPTPTCGITGSADQRGQAQEPPARCSSPGEESKSSERALCTRHYELHCSSGPYHCNQQSWKIRDSCNEGHSWPCTASEPRQSCFLCQVGKSSPFYTGYPLTVNGQLTHQKPYIIGKNLGQTKMSCERVGKYSHHFPWRWNSGPSGVTWRPTLEAGREGTGSPLR